MTSLESHSAPAAYDLAWADLRRRRRNQWLGFFGWAPLALCSLILLQAIAGPTAYETLWFVVVAPGALITLALAFHASTFRCPRCQDRFASTLLPHGAASRRCLHCGLAMGSQPAPRSRPASIAASAA